MKKTGLLLSAVFLIPLLAQKADVIEAKVKKSFGGKYVAYVKIDHKDEGYEHFADRWEIFDQNGKRLTIRIIFSPTTEKETIESYLYGFAVPEGTKKLIFKAHCNKDGWGGKEYVLNLDTNASE